MEKKFDVCIIGAGPAGIFTALQLMNDYKVLLVELGDNHFIGNIFHIIPEKSGFVLLEAISKFDKLMEGKVIDNDSVIIAPEIGNFWPEIETDKSFRTNVPGIFVAGDALGFVRGALQGSVTGIKTANAIKNFYKRRFIHERDNVV